MKKLHRLVKVIVWGQRDGTAERVWIKEQLAELAPRHGGLGIPHVYSSLQQLSANVVG